jgi:hypothetical protein
MGKNIMPIILWILIDVVQENDKQWKVIALL